MDPAAHPMTPMEPKITAVAKIVDARQRKGVSRVEFCFSHPNVKSHRRYPDAFSTHSM